MKEMPHRFSTAKVLFAVDPATTNSDMLGWVAGLARQLGAELHVLRVISANDADRLDDDPDKATRMAKEELTAAFPAEAVLELCIRWEVRWGDVGKQVIAYARENASDLIVLGSRGRRPLSRFLLGSVADEVHQHAPCPLVLIPSGAERLKASQLHEAADVLHASFGDSHEAGASTRTDLTETLKSTLGLSDREADDLLGELQKEQVVQWSPEPPAEEDASATSANRVDIMPGNLEPDELFGEGFPNLADGGPEAPAYDLVRRAVSLGATDIHIDPAGDAGFAVQFRIDGHLEPYCSLDHDIGERLIQRFKALAGLDIVEPFEPKEGYLRLPHHVGAFQVRVTSAPVVGGETICLRVHDEGRIFRTLEALGMSDQNQHAARETLRRREGMIVVTGPSGAGKTTTIYSMLQQLRDQAPHLLIASIEDPVELNVPFMRQLSINESAGLVYHTALSTMLRMDPDVLLVGEIRDPKTAEVIMRAASSGRHVLTTLHSREVAAAVTAFDHLGVDRRSLAANLAGIISQRLVRRLCPECRRQHAVGEREREVFERYGCPVPEVLWQASGCDACRQKGYRGRTGIFNAVVIDDELRESIHNGDSEQQLERTFQQRGASGLSAAALNKVAAGMCDLNEVEEMHLV